MPTAFLNHIRDIIFKTMDELELNTFGGAL
jgi:hypothetical protein